MGTDIHFSAEVRNDEGEWEFVPGPIIDCWACDGTGITRRGVKEGDPCWSCTNDGSASEYDGTEDGESDRAYYRQRYVQPGKTRDRWYSDRNYTVFAILGNVRNGHGFAGVYTHDPLPFISSDRGVPTDATPQTLGILSNEHSATWCTLLEVMEYDWHAPIHRSGVIGLGEYDKLRSTHARPESWSGGISGAGIVTVSMAEADAILAGKLRVDESVSALAMSLVGGALNERVYVQYEWDDTLDEYTALFRDRMKMLAVEVGERECRLIMDFDS